MTSVEKKIENKFMQAFSVGGQENNTTNNLR